MPKKELYTKEDTIFVQIASYRDPELQYTLQDMFKKAKRPENIFVGICHQYDMKGDDDKHLFEVEFPRKEQLRIDEVDYRDAKGCCWARNRIQKLYNGEKWTLMIDSHMRCEEGWDEILVKTIKTVNSPKPLLSTYLCSFDEEYNFEKYISNSKIYFDGSQTPVIEGSLRYDFKESPPGAFCSAHFCFGEAKIIDEVQYDPYLYFIGEEISISVRFWTLGYDIFVPNEVTFYHQYRPKNKKVKRVISYEDDSSWNSKDKISRARVKNQLQILKTKDLDHLQDYEKYSLGLARSLRDYERFSGVDFRNLRLREKAKMGIFGDWKETIKINIVKQIFG